MPSLQNSTPLCPRIFPGASGARFFRRFPLLPLLLLFAFFSLLCPGTESRAATQPPASSTPEPNLPLDPAALQKRFEKVIKDSLARQKIPYRQFSWLAPKAINGDILALPFSIVVGAQKIVLPVYVIDHRYLVTTPLLDITRHYAVVPNIPPPQAVSLFIPSTSFSLDQFPSTGPLKAPHSLVEFGDEQCRTCRKWNREVEAQILKEKTIRFTYIPYPLVTIHQNAMDAAIFEMCVHEEKPDAFWSIHDQLNQRVDLPNIDKQALKPIFSALMVQAGISTAKVRKCMEESQPLPLISKAGNSLTAQIGVPSTPVFLIDGHVHAGYLSYDEIMKEFNTPTGSGTGSPAGRG